MFNKRNKVVEKKPPAEWSDKMVEELANRKSPFKNYANYTLLINEIFKESEITSQGEIEKKLRIQAALGADKFSDLRYVEVEIEIINEIERWRCTATFPNEAIGFLKLNEKDEISGKTIPFLEVFISGGSELESLFEDYFIKTKIFGNHFLPLWIWVDTTTIKGKPAKEAMELSWNSSLPIMKCNFLQVLNLSGAVPQED